MTVNYCPICGKNHVRTTSAGCPKDYVRYYDMSGNEIYPPSPTLENERLRAEVDRLTAENVCLHSKIDWLELEISATKNIVATYAKETPLLHDMTFHALQNLEAQVVTSMNMQIVNYKELYPIIP